MLAYKRFIKLLALALRKCQVLYRKRNITCRAAADICRLWGISLSSDISAMTRTLPELDLARWGESAMLFPIVGMTTSFNALQVAIGAYQAKEQYEKMIAVEFVNPAYTSQTCHRCLAALSPCLGSSSVSSIHHLRKWTLKNILKN